MVVTLPWPPKQLSPNARTHWAVRRLHTQNYRNACFYLAKQESANHDRMAADGPIAVHLAFVPPSRRHYDDDNLIASMKAGLDGLAQALGVDDKRFRLTFEVDRANVAGTVTATVSCAAAPAPLLSFASGTPRP